MIGHRRIETSHGPSRRTFLRAAGATLALPLLGEWPRALASPGEDRPPLRLLFVSLPNGVHMDAWRPRGEGSEFSLPSSLEPLAPYKRQLLVLSGLTLDGGNAHGDGPGDHARAGGSFLTGAHPRKTGGADIEVGTSVDQVAAQALGRDTPLPSLELGCDPSAQSGSCDSGYSCAYSSNIAWSSPSTPLAKEINPRRVFERLFLDGEGLTPDERARRARYRASVLDAVEDDARKVRGRLGGTDRVKLDEYLSAVRELERRMEQDGKRAGGPRADARSAEPPRGIPSTYSEHIRRMYDIARLAFQTDTTRVITFMAANEGSNRSYREIGVPDGHHDISHHGGDEDKHAQLARINRFHVEQLAYLLEQLAAVKEGPGNRTLLDNTIVLMGSGISDGDAHNHDDLPIIVAGRGGGALDSGRHLAFPRGTPLCNLYLWILQRAGVRATSFGDSRGPLNQVGQRA